MRCCSCGIAWMQEGKSKNKKCLRRSFLHPLQASLFHLVFDGERAHCVEHGENQNADIRKNGDPHACNAECTEHKHYRFDGKRGNDIGKVAISTDAAVRRSPTPNGTSKRATARARNVIEFKVENGRGRL